MGLFNRNIINNETIAPVWFMRQAGRYHAHYQNIKKNSHFMEMCKEPSLALEVTMGPIDEFKFDAAILFSDLLFPLEHLGMGLVYDPGPKLGILLESKEVLTQLKPIAPARDFFDFQKKSCELLKEKLPETKTLLGFVGAPFTLYTYAVEGGHSGNLTASKNGFYDGRFKGFMELLLPNVLDEMYVQAEGGADAICIFDTAVGELTLKDFKDHALPNIKFLTREFKKKFPNKKIIYYSKLTHMNYLNEIQDDNIDVLGVDWRHSIKNALKELGNDYYIQGNLDPSHLHLPWNILEEKLQDLWSEVQESNMANKWIAGLGHGVLQRTPEENVLRAVEFIHNNCRY